MAIVTSANLPPEVQQTWNSTMLSTPQSRLIHLFGAMQYEMPDRGGDIMRFSRYNRLATAVVPLGAAMNNPPAQLLTRVDLDARLDYFGTYVVLTRSVTAINQDDVISNLALRLGQSFRESEDELIRDMLAGTASVINAVAGTNGGIAVLKSDLIDLELYVMQEAA